MYIKKKEFINILCLEWDYLRRGLSSSTDGLTVLRSVARMSGDEIMANEITFLIDLAFYQRDILGFEI